MEYTKYDLVTGKLMGAGTMDQDQIPNQITDGIGVLAGVAGDWQTEYVDVTQSPPVLAKIVVPVPTLDQVKAAAKQAVAARRWAAEMGGAPYGSEFLATDDRSKTLILGTAVGAMLDSTFTVDWKAVSGNWLHLDAPGIITAAKTVFGWANTCFQREQALGAMVDGAADVASCDALAPTIQTFWP